MRISMVSVAAASIASALFMGGCVKSSGPILADRPPRPERPTAGEGIGKEKAFPALMQRYWAGKGIPYMAVNEGISGDTTADILARLDSSLAPAAELTILEIGANDAFQRVPVETIESNMKLIIQKIRRGGSGVALSSMFFSSQMLGGDEDYTRRFNSLYAEVARVEKVPVLPPLLRSLFTRSDLWQPDGLHPTEEGHALIAKDLLAYLNPDWKSWRTEDAANWGPCSFSCRSPMRVKITLITVIVDPAQIRKIITCLDHHSRGPPPLG